MIRKGFSQKWRWSEKVTGVRDKPRELRSGRVCVPKIS